MFRNIWFWIAILIIAAGFALTAALGLFYWLVIALALVALMFAVAFLVAAFSVGRAEMPNVPILEKIPHSERIPVIYDGDVTLGFPFRDVGGGLALLYLLGEPRVHVHTVTVTYGSGSVETCMRATRRLLAAIEYDSLPVLPGADGPTAAPGTNQAALRLVDVAASMPGELVVIATGSMTNLRHAAALDPEFFGKLRGLYLWGGVTEPLIWKGHHIAEGNFSVDPQAAYAVLHADCPLTVATGQTGLSAVFRRRQFAALQMMDGPVSRLIARKIRSWFAWTRLWFGDGGFILGDSTAALALVHPEIFDAEQVYVTSTPDDLRSGRLYVDPSEYGPVRLMRRVQDSDEFIVIHFAAWKHLEQLVEIRKGNI
ncbi:MAG TPA: hypothetical protein ENN99_11960 [Chloroflexi bacterium]|nr:hypothetical protein [Chloroflexota bacterium]